MSRYTLAGCGAIVLWAFLAVLSRAASDVPPLQLTAMAFAVSAAFGLSVVAGRGELAVLRQSPLAWLHGVGGLFGFHALYFAALAMAPAAEANLINYLWPSLMVILAVPILGMRLTWRHGLGTLLAATGCAVLLGGGAQLHGDALFGYGLALLSAFTWALYSVLARRLSGVPTGAVAGFCAATALLAAVSHLVFERSVMPDASAWVAVLALGLGPVGGAFFLWDIGMKRGDTLLLGTLAYAAPVCSTLLLCVAGFAPWRLALVVAAALVATGGLVAARARASSDQTASFDRIKMLDKTEV